MDAGARLTSIAQETVNFYGDEITLLHMANGAVYVPIKPITDALGVDWLAQYKRIKRDAVLSEMAQSIFIAATDPHRETTTLLCLPLAYIPGWLVGVHAHHVNSAKKEKLMRYKRECYRMLGEASLGGRLNIEVLFGQQRSLPDADAPVVRAYQDSSALLGLARDQLLLEEYASGQGRQTDDLEIAMSRLEKVADEGERKIRFEQVVEISQAVKSVATLLSKEVRRNAYMAVHAEFYRRFPVHSYYRLPASQYLQVMRFLREWHMALSDDEVPF